MKFKRTAMIAAGVLTVMGGLAIFVQNQQDKYAVMVPGGIAFSDFKGYEDWQPVGPSFTDATSVIRLMVANPVMIGAYKKGVPGNGKPFPEGSKIAKIELFDIGYADGITPVLTVPESPVRDGTRAWIS